MKPQYIIGAIVIIVIIAVIGFVMTRHNSQTTPITNTPNAMNTANSQQVAHPINNSDNTQVTPQSGSNPVFQKGKIGDTFSVTQAFPKGINKMKLRLAQTIMSLDT